jgi:hypothetical protein
MIKTKSILEVEIGGKTIRVECDPDTGLGTLHDALHMMLKFVFNKIQELNKQEEEKKTEENPNQEMIYG